MSEREIEAVFVAAVSVDDRKRDVKPEAARSLSESMANVGLRTPITVRPVNDGERLVLVAGAHRLAAAKLLGWEKIDAFVEDDCDEIDAELWEIAENLHRAELTALERDEQVARWVELTEQRISAQPAQKSRGRPEGGVSAASRELGVNRDDARRATKVASLSEQAKATAREVGLSDNRTALLEASRKSSAEDQVSFLQARAQRQAREKANHELNRSIALTEAEKFADWLSSRIAQSELSTLISWLEGARAKDVIAALRRKAE